MSISLEKQIACVKRELLRRKTVYPPKVRDGKLDESTATDELGTMTAVLYTLLQLLETGGVTNDARRTHSVGKD